VKEFRINIGVEKRNLHKAVVRSGPCFYCGGVAEHADHIVALVHGRNGSVCYEALDRAENMIPSCAHCNWKKNGYPLPNDVLVAAKLQAFILAPDIRDVAAYLNAKHYSKGKTFFAKELAKMLDIMYKPLRDRGLLEGI
jgi:hypothetical protein